MQQEKDEAETSDTRANGVRVALVASVLAGAAHAMVSGLLVMPVSQVLLVLVGGWAWGRYRHEHQSSRASPSFSKWAHASLCAVLLGSIVVVGNGLRDLGAAEERRSSFLEAVERNQLSPRYWTQGYIGVRDSSVIERARRDR
jgi:hypothetical protein